MGRPLTPIPPRTLLGIRKHWKRPLWWLTGRYGYSKETLRELGFREGWPPRSRHQRQTIVTLTYRAPIALGWWEVGP